MKTNSDTRMIEKLYRAHFSPQLLLAGLSAINILTDSIIIGNYLGENGLAAAGFMAPLAMCISSICSYFSVGTEILCAQCLGRGDKKSMKGIFTLITMLCVGFGLFMTAAMLLFPDTLSRILGASGEVGAMTAQYIRGMGIGALATIFMSSLFTFLQMENLRKTMMVCSALTFSIHIGVDLLSALVFDWGMFGMGLAIALANIASCFVALVMLIVKGRLFSLDMNAVKPDYIRQILWHGLPSVLDKIADILGTLVLNSCVALLGGTMGMAALTVARNVENVIGKVICHGGAAAGTIVTGVLVGQRDALSIKKMYRIMVKFNYPLFLIAYALVFVFARPLAQILGANADNLNLCVTAIRLTNLWYLFTPLCRPLYYINLAMGDKKLTIIGNLCVYILGIALACLALPKLFGINILFLYYTVLGIVEGIMYWIGAVLKTKRFASPLSEAIYIPENFTVAPQNLYHASVTTVPAAVATSKDVYDFCLKKGLSKKIAYCASLCLEEIAVDAVKNRFTRKNATLDCQVICENGGIQMMIRDDCRYFDPKAWLDLCSPKDEERSVGIRMVMKAAKNIHYVNTLGLNVLVIELS